MTHDRTGERVDDEPVVSNLDTTAVTKFVTVAHNPNCRNGWLGEDSEGHLIPCLRCKPHLAKTADVNDFGALDR